MLEVVQTVPARPTLVTIVCAIGYVGALLTLPVLLLLPNVDVQAWYSIFLIINSVVQVISLVGCGR
jgi:hypothetical protein